MLGRFGSLDFGDAHAHKDTITLGRRVSYFAEDSMRSALQLFVKTGIHSACSTLERPNFDLERIFQNRAVLCLINLLTG